MCGISTRVSFGAHPNATKDLKHSSWGQWHGASVAHQPTLRAKLNKSLGKISHRGPDERGIWISPDNSIGLAHCRLSINDLSAGGSQPIHSVNNSISVHAVVNGEIYDHDRIRADLSTRRGYTFHGQSDSEVLVALYQEYGAPEFLDHLRGEFAFVLYDEREKKVIAARDRFGIKPLYWTILGGDEVEAGKTRPQLLIASEAKAFLPMGWQPEWDVQSIVGGDSLHGEGTLFTGVQKVLPGHWMHVSLDGDIKHHRYWDPYFKDKRLREPRSEEEMINGVRERLVEAIRLRLRADVPIGIYLSGGIDSSLVAGIATHLVREEGIKMGNQDATRRIRCFTIKFPSKSGFDESSIAERTAEWLGLELVKEEVDEETLARDFSESAYHCEHHNFDLNSVGKHALSRAPRSRGFKVVLTGEGADEHFAGYPLFPADFLRERDGAMPESLLAMSGKQRDAMQQQVERVFTRLGRQMGLASHGYEDSESRRSLNNILMPGFMMTWQAEATVFAPWVRRSWEGRKVGEAIVQGLRGDSHAKIKAEWHPLHASQYIWTKSILPNIILSCEGDRAEMAHSIESRPPFLDHHLAEYVNGIPPSLKIGYAPDRQMDNGSSPLRNDHYRTLKGSAADIECKSQGRAVPSPVCDPHGRKGGQDSSRVDAASGMGTGLDSLSEKWILREAGKPFITPELYQRKKHPYTAPISYPRGGPMYRMFTSLLTHEAVEELGFVDNQAVQDALRRGFADDNGAEADPRAFRILIFVGTWIALSRQFGVKRAGEADMAALLPSRHRREPTELLSEFSTLWKPAANTHYH